MPKPSEVVPIILHYEGPDVDDGSMSIEDIVPVLEGFASAYGRINEELGGTAQHRIRITGVSPGSANIVLEVWNALDRASAPLGSIKLLAGAAFTIASTIMGVIRLKRHIRGKPFSDSISVNHTISITNSENVTLEMPVQVYNIYHSRLIDGDIAKIARPLYPGRIDSAELVVKDAEGEEIRERIEATERASFEAAEVTVTSTRETWLVVKLNSLTKSTMSGYANLTDGSRVFYQYIGDQANELQQIFGAYDGAVRVRAVAHMDDSLKVVRLEISEAQVIQGDLFPKI